MELRRGNPMATRKIAMCSDPSGVDNGPMAVGVPIEFEDPNAVMINEACKYCLFFLALGLFVSTIAAMAILSTGKTATEWKPLEVEIERIPDLDEFCSRYDVNGHCFRHTTIDMHCDTMICRDVSLELIADRSYRTAAIFPEKNLKLYVPNGAICGINSWCMHGQCVNTSDERVPAAFRQLVKINDAGKKTKSAKCVRSSLVNLISK